MDDAMDDAINGDGNPCKIFVGNLSYSCTNKDLQDLFSEYGTIIGIKIVCDRMTNKSKGFGFVTFDDEFSVPLAIQQVNQTSFHNRPITVRSASARGVGPMKKIVNKKAIKGSGWGSWAEPMKNKKPAQEKRSTIQETKVEPSSSSSLPKPPTKKEEMKSQIYDKNNNKNMKQQKKKKNNKSKEIWDDHDESNEIISLKKPVVEEVVVEGEGEETEDIFEVMEDNSNNYVTEEDFFSRLQKGKMSSLLDELGAYDPNFEPQKPMKK